MLMSNWLTRAWFARLAVGLAVLAFPLLATSVAQASIAGAIPSTTTIHPDLRSATIDPTEGPTGVHVCFDKTLNSLVTAPNFFLAGYRAGRLQTASGGSLAAVDPTNTMCVLVSFPAAAGDINNYTILTVSPGAVVANTGLVPNLADSVALTGSTSHSGTTDTTTSPNLVGVLAPSGTNQVTHSLTYVFDKHAVTAAATNTRFFFETASGNLCIGLPIATLSGNGTTTITIQFNDGPCGGVINAVKAGIFQGAVTAQADPLSSNPNVSADLPSCTSPCSTERPDLVSVTMNRVQDSITFTFDRNVVNADAAQFRAEFVNGTSIQATKATCNGAPVCTAQFSGDLSKQSEFAVLAWAGLGAVQSADNVAPSGLSLPGSAPIGGNAGGVARGFTTGPDVFGIVISKNIGQVSVNLDARVINVALSDAGLIRVLDGGGNPILGSYKATFDASAGPGPTQVLLKYPAPVLSKATQVQFLHGGCDDTTPSHVICTNAAFTEPFTEFTVPADAQNVSQIVASVNSSAILGAYNARHLAKSHKHSSRKNVSKRDHRR